MSAQEVPAVIAGSVNLLRLAEALARAGIIGRYDAERHLLVIEPAPERCRACGGSGLDEDSQCEVCDGTGTAELPPQTAQERPGAALAGARRMAPARRVGVPADAVEAWKAERQRAG